MDITMTFGNLTLVISTYFPLYTAPSTSHRRNKEDNSWEVMTVEKGSRVPARRYGHSGVLYSSEMFIFGGYDCDSFTCSDLWSFSFGNLFTLDSILPYSSHLEKEKWNRIETKKSCPPARFLHSAVVAQDLMYTPSS